MGAQRSVEVSVGCACTGATHWRHEQLTLRVVLATAPRRQEPPLPAVTTGTQFFTVDDESVPVTEERSSALLEPRPQGLVQRHSVEHIIHVLPHMQILDVLVPQMGDQLLEVFRLLDSQVPQQRNQQRLVDQDLRHSQIVEQLVEVPTICLFPCSSSRLSGRSLTFVLCGRRGGGGGLQGFLPAQNTTTQVSPQIVTFQFAAEVFKVFVRFQQLHPHRSAPRREVECWSRRALEHMDAGGFLDAGGFWTPAAFGRRRLMSQESPCRRRRTRTPTAGLTSTAASGGGRVQSLRGGSCSVRAWMWRSSGTSPVTPRWVLGATWCAAASSWLFEVSVVLASASFWSTLLPRGKQSSRLWRLSGSHRHVSLRRLSDEYPFLGFLLPLFALGIMVRYFIWPRI